MQMPITGKVLPSSFLLLRFPLSLWLLQPSFELALVTTARTTNRRTSTRPRRLTRTSLMPPDPPRPAYLLFTSPRPAEESHQRLDCTGLSATVVDSGPSKRSRSHTRTRVLEPAPAVTVIESSAPLAPRPSSRTTIWRASRPMSRLVPASGSGNTTSSRWDTVMRQAAAAVVLRDRTTMMSRSLPMSENAPGSVVVGLRGAGILGMIKGGLGQRYVRFVLFMMTDAHTLLCGECRSQRVLCIDLLLNI